MSRKALAAAALALDLFASTAHAGPFRDSEAQVAQAYADYRVALFQTNQKNREATIAALSAFRTKWAALTAAWKTSPPPQYADDPGLGMTLDAVAHIAEEAETATAGGDLLRAHDILEAIRDQLGTLRARNGVITFSDRMNAYHEVMEHAAEIADMSQASALEHAGILAHLVKQIAANRPNGVDAAAFETALKALDNSIVVFQTAARSGDRTAINAARNGLKQPYSRMFLRFG
jgi:uncharacterized protein YbaA (DUF1428 family)